MSPRNRKKLRNLSSIYQSNLNLKISTASFANNNGADSQLSSRNPLNASYDKPLVNVSKASNYPLSPLLSPIRGNSPMVHDSSAEYDMMMVTDKDVKKSFDHSKMILAESIPTME